MIILHHWLARWTADSRFSSAISCAIEAYLEVGGGDHEVAIALTDIRGSSLRSLIDEPILNIFQLLLFFGLQLFLCFVQPIFSFLNLLSLQDFHLHLDFLQSIITLSELWLVAVLIHDLDLGHLFVFGTCTVFDNGLKLVLEIILQLILLVLSGGPNFVYSLLYMLFIVLHLVFVKEVRVAWLGIEVVYYIRCGSWISNCLFIGQIL